MARSELDSLDYCAVTLDEIALEGLDGITLPALWTRLSNQPNFGLSIDDASKNFIWKVIRTHKELEFYQLPEDRPDFVPFNRFAHLDHDYGIVVEPAEMPEDPYPFESVDDPAIGVRGSCATYLERVPVTERVATLTLQEAERKFGRSRLVVVASQRMRNAVLVPISSMDVETELNLSQFVLLERIGRSRSHGEVTVGAQGLSVLKEPPKNLYYLRKKLLEYRLITKQGFCMRGANGKNCQGRLYHLPRFFREFRPKYEVMIEQAVEILRAQPGHIMLLSEFSKLFENPFGLKKVAKMSEFQRFIKWEMVPHRTIYPDATRAEWIVKNTGQERSCRVYRLLDPTVSVREALEEPEDDADPEGDALLKFPDQSSLSLQHSFERQAFSLMNVYGARGIDSNTLRRELGQTPLDARALLKSLTNVKQSVETFREDVGRTRITKYVASRFVHMSGTKLEFSVEEQRLKSLAIKTDPDAPPEPQLPQLSPAGPVFVMAHRAGEETDDGPPVLTPVITPPPRPVLKPAKKAVTVATTAASPAASAARASTAATAVASADKAELMDESKVSLQDGDNLIDMEHCFLELIDPISLQPTSPPKSTIPLEKTVLFSKSSSSRLVKRTRIILEIIQKLKIIDNAYQLRRMVQNNEDDQGIMTKMDRKSFNRILKRLADAGLIKNYRLTLSRGGQTRQRHLITDKSVGPENTLLRSAIEQAKAAFLVMLGVTSAMQGDAPAADDGPSTDGLAPDVASSVREYHARFLTNTNIGINDVVEKPHRLATKRKQNETYFVPKFRRLQLLQELLFYISRQYAGDPDLDQTEPRRQMLEIDPSLDAETLPRAYSSGPIDWQTFISPLPTHASWGHGWSLLCDVLIRMPLCVFLRLVNIPYFTPDVHRYMAHRVLRNLPPTHLPEDVVSCLFWKRRYMFAIHDDITRLVFMGLAQLGQQMLAKDQVFVFCNRNASLLDTSISKEGYHRVDPDVQYPVKMYHFDSLSALKDYWFDLKTIALSTALGSRNLVIGQKITIEIPFYKPQLVKWARPRAPHEADGLDQGQIPGDQLGAGGIDTSMFAHVLRNWKWKRMAHTAQSIMMDKRPAASRDSGDGSGPSGAHATRDGAGAAGRGGKRKRRDSTGTRRRATPKLMDPPAEPLGPVVDVQIHKPSDGSAERAVVVTRGKNVPRSRGTRKRPASERDDSQQPGPSEKRRNAAAGNGIDTQSIRPGLAERRLRVFRPNQKTKFERIMGVKKKRGPKPPRDETDKKALQLLKKQRCDWSERENTYLLLARVALGLLVDTFKVPSRQYLTVRDALHETIEESRNKTAHAVHRRIAFMLRRSQTVANVSLTIQEHMMDPEIRAIIGAQPLTQNIFNTEVVFPKLFRQVMAVLLAKYDRSAVHGQILPSDYQQLKDQYDIVMGDNVRLGLVVPAPELTTEGDVHLHTVAGLVVSYLASREDKSCPMTQLYHASQRYPEELMFAALTQLRTAGVASQRRGHAGIRVIKESKGLLQPTTKPYILSTKFRHKFIQRYQYGLYSDCFNFFKTLLWNSLKEEALTSIGAIQRGGQAAMIFSLMANNRLLYEVTVPENLIRLSRRDQEQGNALMQNLQERAARQDPSALDDGHMSLGRTGAGGQRRVGLRSSMSRLVLLAARESRDTELEMADGGRGAASRKDTHEYHEQLHIVPFTVLARLTAPEASPAAGTAEDGADGSMEVDEQYIPVSPLLAQAARDKHARMLSPTAPPPESVFERLLSEDAATTEDVRQMKYLLSLLDDAGALGMPPAQLLAECSVPRAELRRLCELMVREELILRCGVSHLVYVARGPGQPWVLHSYHMTRTQQDTVASRVAAAGGDLRAAPEKNLQSVFFLPVPWRRISGSVNRRVLDRLSGALLSHCMAHPGASLSAVQQHFHPMLTGQHVRLLVETLAELGCVKLTETRQVSRTTLFSRRTDLVWYDGDADDFSEPENVVIQPSADATLRYACFIGDKPYTQEFLDTIGL